MGERRTRPSSSTEVAPFCPGDSAAPDELTEPSCGALLAHRARPQGTQEDMWGHSSWVRHMYFQGQGGRPTQLCPGPSWDFQKGQGGSGGAAFPQSCWGPGRQDACSACSRLAVGEGWERSLRTGALAGLGAPGGRPLASAGRIPVPSQEQLLGSPLRTKVRAVHTGSPSRHPSDTEPSAQARQPVQLHLPSPPHPIPARPPRLLCTPSSSRTSCPCCLALPPPPPSKFPGRLPSSAGDREGLLLSAPHYGSSRSPAPCRLPPHACCPPVGIRHTAGAQ